MFLMAFVAYSTTAPGTFIVNVDHHIAFLDILQLEWSRIATQTLILYVECVVQHTHVKPE